MMEMILNQDVPNLGHMGDLVTVKSGYARNFLLPKKLAYLATPSNLKRIEQQKAKITSENAAQKSAAEELAQKLAKSSCTITVEVNDLEKMYGSVTDVDIVQALVDEGFEIDRKMILLENPIEDLGIYEVGIKLHSEVTAQVRIWVAKK